MKLEPVDISQTESVATIVFKELRKAIFEGKLETGEPLRQDEIAKLFNTSRIPVREAIYRLEEQGLVKTQRYKGAFVVGIEPNEVSEIFDFRALVESRVIEVAVPKLTKDCLEQARRYCDAFSDSTDPMQWNNLNLKFHETLYAASGMPYHLSVVDQALDRTDRFVRAQLIMTNGLTQANAEHHAILDACATRNAKGAADLTRKHILDAKTALLDYLKTSNPPQS